MNSAIAAPPPPRHHILVITITVGPFTSLHLLQTWALKLPLNLNFRVHLAQFYNSEGGEYTLHLREFLKPTPNLDFLARLKKLLSNNSLSQVSIFRASERNPIARIYTRAYASTNMDVEDTTKNRE